MAWRDWQNFSDDYLDVDEDVARELYDLGIRRPDDIIDYKMRWNFDTELWDITFHTSYGDFILEDTSPLWYDDEIRGGVGFALFDAYDTDFGDSIAVSYRKSKGGR